MLNPQTPAFAPDAPSNFDPGPIAPQSAGIQVPDVPQIKRGGMFGSGRNAGDLISSFILNYAAGQGNPIGTNYLQAQRYKQQMALEQQQYEARQRSELQRQMAMYQFQMQNPNSDEMQLARQAGIQPGTPAWQSAMGQAFQNKVNPFQMMTFTDADGTQRQQLVRPSMAPPQQQPRVFTPDDPRLKGATPVQGGPTQPASGTFQY